MSDARSFIYQWAGSEWTKKIRSGWLRLDYLGGERFAQVGVKPGDQVFVVSVRVGELFLGGRVVVSAVCDLHTAASILTRDSDDLWPASQYVIAEPSTVSDLLPGLIVPAAVVDRLEMFSPGKKRRTVKRRDDGRIDPQTLRHLGELMPGSAQALTRELERKFSRV
ncbi:MULTISPECIES: hypothetical protein [unclassified Ectothiorhodospira]|uniref:hypothetical protein n=1 Tax=unclassified Ectothiorhodospira TaxID=2684909 RepID=UPI001EE94781|nr:MULTISPECIES: hypothetical protein [unclassified Ectothiorhodospira]MCG5516810.1 hypothetical protein [Ectothiorhodospira sp. 9100]MCG5519772.1 hypothetical protein [Ectothiorhodospira sp. 9905]